MQADWLPRALVLAGSAQPEAAEAQTVGVQAGRAAEEAAAGTGLEEQPGVAGGGGLTGWNLAAAAGGWEAKAMGALSARDSAATAWRPLASGRGSLGGEAVVAGAMEVAAKGAAAVEVMAKEGRGGAA